MGASFSRAAPCHGPGASANGSGTVNSATTIADVDGDATDFSYVVLHNGTGSEHAFESLVHRLAGHEPGSHIVTGSNLNLTEDLISLTTTEFQPTIGMQIQNVRMDFRHPDEQARATKLHANEQVASTKLCICSIGSSGERPPWGLLGAIWEPYQGTANCNSALFFLADFQTRGSYYFFHDLEKQCPTSSFLAYQAEREPKELEAKSQRREWATEKRQERAEERDKTSQDKQLSQQDDSFAHICLDFPHLYLTQAFERPSSSGGGHIYLPERFVEDFVNSWGRDFRRLMEETGDRIYPISRPWVLLLDYDDTLLELPDGFFGFNKEEVLSNLPKAESVVKTGSERLKSEFARLEQLEDKRAERLKHLEDTLTETLTYFFSEVHGITMQRPFCVRLIQVHALRPHKLFCGPV